MWDKLKPIIEWFTDSSGDTAMPLTLRSGARVLMMLMGRETGTEIHSLSGGGSGSGKQRLGATGPNPFMINKATAPKVDVRSKYHL